MTRADFIAGLLTVALLALFWTATFKPDHSWGWDESMHAGLPAARMLTSGGEPDAKSFAEIIVQDCQRYPFVVPCFLALVQADVEFGLSQSVTRVALRLLYCVGLFGVFLLARVVLRSMRTLREGQSDALDLTWLDERTVTKVLFGALAFGALCPLAFAFSGTLFLEVPFLVAEVFCLLAWLSRRAENKKHKHEIASDLAAGCCLVVCFFTKFNYGCLLAAALAFDLAIQGVGALRSKRLPLFVYRSFWLAAPIVIALAWWFCWPWPGNAELALSHRNNFISYLQGNQSGYVTPWSRRILDWGAAFVPTLRFGLLLLLGVLASLRWIRVPAVRLLWIVVLTFGISISLHPFHLERFLIPLGPGLWVLGALGLGTLASWVAQAIDSRLARWALGILVLAACLAFPERDSRFLAKRVGLWNEEQADYLTWLFASWRSLAPDRNLPTSGLRTETFGHILDLIEPELTPTDSIGWIGISTEFSPAALHLGLLERGRSATDFQRATERQMFVDFRGQDPHWKPTLFRNWAEQFDVIFCTDPPDMKARASRVWTAEYVERLRNELGWSRRELGAISIERPFNEPILVTLFACRPPS